jgi:hypothetical protein
MPAVAEGVGLPWDVPVTDPVAAIAAARSAHGDTFVVDSGPDRYLFTFSPAGVAAFYALPEEQASKGVADWRMLRRKVPDEVFVDRRTLPHQLFGREDVTTYLANVERALGATVAELGDEGEVDVFELTRRLGHRVGLASWGGPGSADGTRFDRLAAAFDVLDGPRLRAPRCRSRGRGVGPGCRAGRATEVAGSCRPRSTSSGAERAPAVRQDRRGLGRRTRGRPAPGRRA